MLRPQKPSRTTECPPKLSGLILNNSKYGGQNETSQTSGGPTRPVMMPTLFEERCVTAALSAAAAARVSLTSRNLASSVVFATAHRADNSALNWRELALSGSAIVFYMPGQQYAEISERLLDAGLDKDVPCLIVSRASSEAQLIHHATVGSLLYATALSAPSILLVGKALLDRDDLGCQEQQGSSANKSPETAYARALEPPQTSRNSQTPHFP